ncbi:Carbon monoxide dehydrogenase subunit G [Lentzea albidocapillata subsp. violacea]|uniref:Carbon monoxide dehydrogenase subunit G n=1 Tax=Lentzea albidocapillata subsp. violacea TaxID=128104 RepID=A0A1G9Y334_9PSEU|nr:SRPBCC family protein [Lentzea albidocapillata]SDN03427.1 Carbon monoxide dehydrogenase subunit G [Lentzea albidocapillata subsp. violacea]
MKLTHSFTAPAPAEEVWQALIDPERVAPCLPGATLTSVDGKTFSGEVKVRLGPVQLLYRGSGEFVEIDPVLRRAVMKAAGKDTRGNGTASAVVTFVVGDSVEVETDLAITGRPAQLGRGLIAEVSGRLVDQFAECLASTLGSVDPDEVAQQQHLRVVPDEPIDLIDTAGVPVLKRVLPIAAAALAVVLFVVLRRRRQR